MKKTLILILILCAMQTSQISLVKANSETLNSTEDIEVELENTVDELLDNFDLDKLDTVYVDEYGIFDESTFKEKVEALLDGKYFDNYDSIFKAIISLVFDGVASMLPLFLVIIAIAILASILNNIKSDSKNNVSSIINFVCMAVIISVIAINFTSVIEKTSECLNLMKKQMDIIFPIILTLMSAIGGNVSVSIFKPIVAVLSSVISTLFQTLLLPMFVLVFLFTIVGSLSKNVKLDKITGFVNSSFKWIVGFVFTIFSAFLTIQGISAGKYDGVSIKASKFAIKSYIPIIGGYLSEGFDFIMLGSMLIKNAIGVGGLIILFLTILSPLIQIIVFKLGLQLVAGIIEPTNNSEICDFIGNCSKVLTFPIVIILGVAFMYVLLVALLMCSVSVL